jgi:dihydrofolate reductase
VDGFIAGPDDDYDWITPEPSFDFGELYGQFETLLMGRRTYEVVHALGEDFRGKQIIVASRTLRAEEHPDIEVIGDGLDVRLRELREQAGRDIWLFGGGALFSQILEWDLVDTVEPAIIPILLGSGVPLVRSPAVRRRLKLIGHRIYPSGMITLEYQVEKRSDSRHRDGS